MRIEFTDDEWILIENALDGHRQRAEQNRDHFEQEAREHAETDTGGALSVAAQEWEMVANQCEALLNRIDPDDGPEPGRDYPIVDHLAE